MMEPLPELYWTHKMVESYMENAAEVMKSRKSWEPSPA